MLKSLLFSSLLVFGLSANTLTQPEIIFQKKCQMCHALAAPENDQEQKAMVAPL